jgi:mannose-6-phosphate isomerase-like protein (cupin superfamily)
MPDVFEVRDRLAQLAPGEHASAEFFRSPTGSLSMTAARWRAGSVDNQQPHTEDEVYYLVAGRAVLLIDGHPHAVQPGSIAFVAAGVEHRFTEINEDLEVIVFWSPARRSNA